MGQKIISERSAVQVVQNRLRLRTPHTAVAHLGIVLHTVVALQAANKCDLLEALLLLATDPLKLQVHAGSKPYDLEYF